ncbi:hypothetical protein Rctr197k_122 [Virus Rctr197k]|nr:hypothetical protein Rctr197k_122 [Virus Rctr197k]
MARHAHEFSCTECQHYNYPMLSDQMNGNYTIICGHCQHQHYRVIKAGVVTEDRHNKNLPPAEIIHVMPSACQKEKRELGQVAQLRQMEAAGLHEAPHAAAPTGPSPLRSAIKTFFHKGRPKDTPA